MPTIVDNDGNDCSPYQICPVMCKEGYKPCLTGVLDNGCPTARLGNLCIQRFSSTDQVCEESCPLPSCTSPPSKVCSGGIDDTTGCSLDRFCADIEFGNDGEPCPPICPPTCPPGVPTCPGEIDPNGCKVEDTCAPGMYLLCKILFSKNKIHSENTSF